MITNGSPDRVAILSLHSSPLLEPGSGDSGGMTIYVRELTAALARLGVTTDIFTKALPDAPRVTSIGDGVRVVSIDAGPDDLPKEELPGYIDDFIAGVQAFATTQRISYDILHSHYWHSGIAATQLARTWNAPHVHSHHTLGRVKNRFLAPGDAPEPQSRLDGEEEVIGSADVLVASTDEEWSQLSCLYGAPHDRLKTVHPGVDHQLFSPGDRGASRAQIGLDEDELVMLYVGRIQPLKGIGLAIEAVEQLVGALDRPLTFVVVGGASGAAGEGEVTRLKQLAGSLGVADRVRFVGPQPHVKLPDFYRAADVLVMCSYSESFGLTALEAQACAIPVVATAVGGLGHIVMDGETGYLVEDRDPAVFAARMKTLLSDPDLRADFSRRAGYAAQRFSWQATADTTHELYECLVRERLPEACTC
jgi:D-inositol-3-phosphate glycosyltransferase